MVAVLLKKVKALSEDEQGGKRKVHSAVLAFLLTERFGRELC